MKKNKVCVPMTKNEIEGLKLSDTRKDKVDQRYGEREMSIHVINKENGYIPFPFKGLTETDYKHLNDMYNKSEQFITNGCMYKIKKEISSGDIHILGGKYKERTNIKDLLSKESKDDTTK